MRLYHAYAFNEETKQVIEGDMEDPDEEFVRAQFQQQLMMTLMQMEMMGQTTAQPAPPTPPYC